MKRLMSIAALMLAGFAAPALAQGGITESYCAYLSNADHYNSKGGRLTTPGQVIRQDRANFHRFNLRDDADDWDSLFADANNRARLEKLMNAALKSDPMGAYIVSDDVIVCFDIINGGSSAFDVRLVMGE